MSNYPSLNLLVAGESLDASGRETIDVLDPSTGEAFASLPKATPTDLDNALEAASRGFKAWRATSADRREAVLRKGAALIRETAKDLAAPINAEGGSHVKEALRDV
ncbi:MAG TPA: NAD-dependent succinate-semialdehyde dehydrogenase, partial [Erythrobacter sp.]|nr:NAD-dependent succinate-semialdehyde dehydrogenase [Erythrobacter sp.]